MGRVFDGLTQSIMSGFQAMQQTPYKIAQIELEGERYRDSRDFRNKQFAADEEQRRIANVRADEQLRMQREAAGRDQFNFDAKQQQYWRGSATEMGRRLQSAKTPEEANNIVLGTVRSTPGLLNYLVGDPSRFHPDAVGLDLAQLQDGSFAVSIKKKDGSEGVLTENRLKPGTPEGDADPVVRLSIDELREVIAPVLAQKAAIDSVDPRRAQFLSDMALVGDETTLPQFDEGIVVAAQSGDTNALLQLLDQYMESQQQPPQPVAESVPTGGALTQPTATPKQYDSSTFLGVMQPVFDAVKPAAGKLLSEIGSSLTDRPSDIIARRQAEARGQTTHQPVAESAKPAEPAPVVPKVTEQQVQQDPQAVVGEYFPAAQSGALTARNKASMTMATRNGPSRLPAERRAALAAEGLHLGFFNEQQAVNFAQHGHFNMENLNLAYAPFEWESKFQEMERREAALELKTRLQDDKDYADKFRKLDSLFKDIGKVQGPKGQSVQLPGVKEEVMQFARLIGAPGISSNGRIEDPTALEVFFRSGWDLNGLVSAAHQVNRNQDSKNRLGLSAQMALMANARQRGLIGANAEAGAPLPQNELKLVEQMTHSLSGVVAIRGSDVRKTAALKLGTEIFAELAPDLKGKVPSATIERILTAPITANNGKTTNAEEVYLTLLQQGVQPNQATNMVMGYIRQQGMLAK